MLGFLQDAFLFVIPFLAVITVVVFFHELGHFLVARWNNVRVDVFSIGFGGEIFGWNDRHGTRWRVSWVPLGGYVKFFGDAGATSAAGDDLDTMSDAEKAVSFHHKGVWQRASVVVAGPIANFILAILIFAAMFMVFGERVTAPIVEEVIPESAAAEAGFRAGDVITALDGRTISRFGELRAYVQPRADQPIEVTLLRDGVSATLTVIPAATVVEGIGGKQTIGVIGLRPPQGTLERRGPGEALIAATGATYNIVEVTLVYLGNVITGRASADQLSGPLGIAGAASDVARVSIIALIQFAAIISVALGLFNLFPIPLLDGGHLLFYALEALRGRPLSERAQELGFRFGMLVVITIFVVATFNDVSRLGLVGFVSGLFG